MKMSITDIAKKAGVSPATVSLVMNNRPSRISDETKRRVVRIAREMNYMPNQIAVSLAKQRTNTIGLLLPTMDNPFFWRIARGVEHYCSAHGVAAIIRSSEENAGKCFAILDWLTHRCVDGVLVIPSNDIHEENYSERMRGIFDGTGIPMLLVDRAVENVFCDFVTLDNHAAGAMGAEHLLEHGHTRIGFLSGPQGNYSAGFRLQGFMDAMRNYGIDVPQQWIYYGDYETESGYAGTRQLLAQGVTAVFASNDLMAYGAYQYALDERVSIPAELSLVGIDNAMDGRIPVPLTTIQQPGDEIGRKACEMLIYRINHPGSDREYEDVFFPPQLVPRSTVAPPSGRNRS